MPAREVVMATTVDDPANDPLVAMVNERLAAIEAGVPQDLTKVTPNRSPIGLESLIAASLQGDEGEPPPPANAAASAPGAETVRIYLNEVINDQISAATIAIDVDKITRVVFLAVVSPDLASIGVGVGAAITAINGNAPYEFLEGGLPVGEILQCDVALGARTIRLALIFQDEGGLAEQAPSDAASAGPASASGFTLPDELAVHAANWSPPDSGDYAQPERVRPPRPMASEWRGWGREPDDPYWWDRRPAPRPVFKQTCPLYDRRR
jgi:hypothetical protein